MSQEEPEILFGRGHVVDVPDERDYAVDTVSLREIDTAASHFTIFDPTGPSYQQIVFNQFSAGTCTCNAVASAYMYELQRQKVPIGDYRPSRLFLYYVARYARIYDKDIKPTDIPTAEYYKGLMNNVPTVPLLDDSGSQVRDVIKIMGSLGAPQELEIFKPADYAKYRPGSGTWPYDRFAEPVKDKFKDQDWPAKAPDSSCYKKEVLHTVLNYSRPELTVDSWKACIKNGYPVMFGFKWYEPTMSNFFYGKRSKNYKYVVPVPDTTKEKQDGGHAVLAVGWNDKVNIGDGKEPVGCFRVQNSWGWQWGDEGYYWMPYKFLRKQGNVMLVNDPWTLMQGTPNA